MHQCDATNLALHLALYLYVCVSITLKAGSQYYCSYDQLRSQLHFCDWTQGHNAKNTRIESNSSLVSHCVASIINA